jgi:hypothetical protein
MRRQPLPATLCRQSGTSRAKRLIIPFATGFVVLDEPRLTDPPAGTSSGYPQPVLKRLWSPATIVGAQSFPSRASLQDDLGRRQIGDGSLQPPVLAPEFQDLLDLADS